MSRIRLPNGTNVDLVDPIWAGGHFYWYEATKGGDRIPTNVTELNGIFLMAKEAEEARLVLGEPMIVTSWYRPPSVHVKIPGAARNSQHLPGKAIDFYCKNLTPLQIYRKLDPMWNGGLGLYGGHVHIDVRGSRARF
jgi:Peptidase M15